MSALSTTRMQREPTEPSAMRRNVSARRLSRSALRSASEPSSASDASRSARAQLLLARRVQRVRLDSVLDEHQHVVVVTWT